MLEEFYNTYKIPESDQIKISTYLNDASMEFCWILGLNDENFNRALGNEEMKLSIPTIVKATEFRRSCKKKVLNNAKMEVETKESGIDT